MKEEANKRKPDMSITFRIYRMHDLPLLVLKAQKNVMFQNMIKKALKMYASGHIARFEISNALEPVRLSDLPYVARVSLNLYEPEDEDIIEMLSKIQDGYQTNFIKDVAMYCLYAGGLEPYFEHPEDLDKVSAIGLRDKTYKQVVPLSKRGKDRLKKMGIKPKTDYDVMPVTSESFTETPITENLEFRKKNTRRGVAHSPRVQRSTVKANTENIVVQPTPKQETYTQPVEQPKPVYHEPAPAPKPVQNETPAENINPMGFFNNLM